MTITDDYNFATLTAILEHMPDEEANRISEANYSKSEPV